MYPYDEDERAIIELRVRQFRNQLERYQRGELTDEEFAPLRLQNGLYLQRHAYMLRVAIPYGTLSSAQLRALADIAERYDRGYGHFTTRQNIQYNWLTLEQVPDILADLAAADMHAIQTSGNCIRNITADPFAGVAADEVADPRPVAELLRQWSALHPEFAFLPRKFKIAVTGSSVDRAAVYFHDIGLRIVRNAAGAIGFEVIVGGGQGRTPVIGQVLNEFVSRDALLPYLEAIMRVYNLHGRRDNKYKARIKILVKALGLDAFRSAVEAEFATMDARDFAGASAVLHDIEHAFVSSPADTAASEPTVVRTASDQDATQPRALRDWLATNVHEHLDPARAIAVVTLKAPGRPPGDASAAEMRRLADLADEYSDGELRVTHEQNLVLPHVRRGRLEALWSALDALGLARANHGRVTDIIACPGLDYCNLANARAIPIAEAITERFADPAREAGAGDLSIKISGCINACGHHHVGHIGILGVEKGGREFYQLTLGGDASLTPALGERLGRALEADAVVDAVEALVEHHRAVRENGESMLETVRRTGADSFKEAVYGTHR